MWDVVQYGATGANKQIPPIFVTILAAGIGPRNIHSICGPIRDLVWNVDEEDAAINAEKRLIDCIHKNMPDSKENAMEIFAVVHNEHRINTVTAYWLKKKEEPKKLVAGRCYAIGGKPGSRWLRRKMLKIIPKESISGGYTDEKFAALKTHRRRSAFRPGTTPPRAVHLLELNRVTSTLHDLSPRLSDNQVRMKGEDFKVPIALSVKQKSEVKIEWPTP